AVEFRAQLQRFQDLVGRPPAVVNSHHHVQIFPPVGGVLCRLLAGFRPAPYVRRVREAWRTLAAVPGARCKRLLLSTLGRLDARRLRRAGFPGNDCLAGVTDPPWVADPEFLTRWLAHVPGRVVELTCHPGHLDLTLLGRDAVPGDGQVPRRVCEFGLLRDDRFADACRRAGFTLLAPSALTAQ